MYIHSFMYTDVYSVDENISKLQKFFIANILEFIVASFRFSVHFCDNV